MPSNTTSLSDSPHNVQRKTHLIVYFHGLHGVAGDFAYFAAQLKSDESIDSLIIRSNEKSYTSTLDGIDRGGLRAADEIEQRIVEADNDTEHFALTHISLIGHSLGGLYARFTAFVLHRRGVFDRLTPELFITFGSPHAGSLQHYRLFKPFGVPNTVLTTIFTTAIGRTGQQLTFNDNDDIEDDDEQDKSKSSSSDKNSSSDHHVPLLLRMSEPEFTNSLLLFKRRVLYANINGDFSVHFCTAAITHANPFKAHPAKHIPRLDDYATIIDQAKFDEIQQNDDTNKKAAITGEPSKTELFASLSTQPAAQYLRDILRNFDAVPFERFYIVGRSIWAHTDMIVKWRWFSSHGKPVVAHCINIIHDTMNQPHNKHKRDIDADNDIQLYDEEKELPHGRVSPSANAVTAKTTTPTSSTFEEKEQIAL